MRKRAAKNNVQLPGVLLPIRQRAFYQLRLWIAAGLKNGNEKVLPDFALGEFMGDDFGNIILGHQHVFRILIELVKLHGYFPQTAARRAAILAAYLAFNSSSPASVACSRSMLRTIVSCSSTGGTRISKPAM